MPTQSRTWKTGLKNESEKTRAQGELKGFYMLKYAYKYTYIVQ